MSETLLTIICILAFFQAVSLLLIWHGMIVVAREIRMGSAVVMTPKRDGGAP